MSIPDGGGGDVFIKFPGGITEHARILYASDAALPSPTNGTGVAAATRLDTQNHYHSFTAAYLDISRGPETQMWMYSTLERYGSSEMEEKKEQRQRALHHTVSLLRAARRIREHHVATPSQSSPLGPCILAGTLNEALRIALRDESGVASSHVSLYDKWLLDVRGLPLVGNGKEEPLLEPGMRWGAVRREDIALVLSRSDVPRKDQGPDASLSSLHCEESYRGRGYAKAVATKLIKDHLKDYGGGDSTLCCAEVASNNLSSQGVCKSLGGKIGWAVSW
ncbi:uncharacterized protein PG986_013621 [Apiospora aurea]|uniref:N-acetyltransferase domain-containing protein n=1 Tax=Apiospora aurea TaxID=335848 RepID=A0ABR1PW38_9PEZI